jgi:hypothetical protein
VETTLALTKHFGLLGSLSHYIGTWMWSDNRRVLDLWSDLLDSLIQLVTTLYNSLLHAHTNVHSHFFTSHCSVAASNGRRYPSSGFPNYPRRQLPASLSNSSQRLNLSSPLTNPDTLTQLNSTDWLTELTSPAYNISARTAQKSPYLWYILLAVP